MNIVNQGFDDGLSPLEPCLARADRVTELPFDDRVDGFRFPALAEEPIQTSGSNQVCSGLSLWMEKFAMPSDRRNDIQRAQFVRIETGIRQHDPSALLGCTMRAKSSTAAFQGIEMSHIITWSITRLPGKDVLTFCANCISTFDPVFVRSATAGLIIQTGLSR